MKIEYGSPSSSGDLTFTCGDETLTVNISKFESGKDVKEHVLKWAKPLGGYFEK